MEEGRESMIPQARQAVESRSLSEDDEGRWHWLYPAKEGAVGVLGEDLLLRVEGRK